MRFAPPLVSGRLIERRSRFVAEVEIDGRRTDVYCPSTGTLSGCVRPGAEVALRRAERPGRRYGYTWTLVRRGRHLLGIDPSLAPALVAEALRERPALLPELAPFDELTREVRYGREGSRVDLVMRTGLDAIFIEIKNITLVFARGGCNVGAFPDAVTARGLKHLRELERSLGKRTRAAVVFVAQGGGVQRVVPADEVDPEFGRGLRAAAAAGVEIYAVTGAAGRHRIVLDRRIPVAL